MPVREADPWRLQYFAHVDAAANIPTEDSDAWQWYPAHRFVYDKLELALGQSLDAAPHGVPPPHYPVFSKPIVNLRGMGVGSRVLNSQADYHKHYTPGHFWMTLLDGRHVSSDIALVDGEPRWWRHVTGKPAGEGTFDYWIVHAGPDAGIETHCGEWVRKISPAIPACSISKPSAIPSSKRICVFPTNGPIFMARAGSMPWSALRAAWDFPDDDRSEGYSVVLFGPNGRRYRHPPPAVVDEVKAIPGVTSVQITFHEDRAPELHAMPPGGFRLAIVNGFDLRAALAGRDRLKEYFLPHSPQA